MIRALILAAIFTGLLLILIGAPRAEDCLEGAYGCNHHQNHDEYRQWQRKGVKGWGGQGISCCNDQDCRPARVRWNDEIGLWQWWDPENRYWVTAPKVAELEKDKLGDGRAHVCAPPSYQGAPADSRITYCISPSEPKY